LRSSTDPMTSSLLRFIPSFGSHTWTIFSSSLLRVATCLNYLLNNLYCILAINALTGHLNFVLMGHSYTHRDLASCCTHSESSSILTLISTSSLSLVAFSYCWWFFFPPCW